VLSTVCVAECKSGSVYVGMPVPSTEANVTLQLLLMMMLLAHHCDARSFGNCRPASTADNQQRLLLPAATVCAPTVLKQLQHPLQTLDDATPSKTATIQQVRKLSNHTQNIPDENTLKTQRTLRQTKLKVRHAKIKNPRLNLN